MRWGGGDKEGSARIDATPNGETEGEDGRVTIRGQGKGHSPVEDLLFLLGAYALVLEQQIEEGRLGVECTVSIALDQRGREGANPLDRTPQAAHAIRDQRAAHQSHLDIQ